MKIINKKNENSLIFEFIRFLKKIALKKKTENKRLSLVLTGGSSPKKLYKQMSAANIDWSNIDLFWGDERFVSDKSKNSNYNLAYNLLIKKINIDKKNIFKIDTGKKNISKTCNDYKLKINKYFKGKKINFDVFLLGMGMDGHIASIFPHSVELKNNFLVKSISRKDFHRITLSLNIINNSKNIILWLNKKSKTSAFKRLRKKGKNIPVNCLRGTNTFLFKIN